MSGRKLGTTLKYEHFAIIRGNGPFPIDMLRYDSCYPLREKDAGKIESVSNPMIGDNDPWEIRVHKHTELARHARWTPERWVSFGCTLEEDERHGY